MRLASYLLCSQYPRQKTIAPQNYHCFTLSIFVKSTSQTHANSYVSVQRIQLTLLNVAVFVVHRRWRGTWVWASRSYASRRRHGGVSVSMATTT